MGASDKGPGRCAKLQFFGEYLHAFEDTLVFIKMAKFSSPTARKVSWDDIAGTLAEFTAFPAEEGTEAGQAAVIVIGPNNIVENNRIILAEPGSRRKGFFSFFSRKPKDEKGKAIPEPLRTAILLRDASGTRITGNTIEVAGASATRHAIYVRDASKQVVIEDNRIAGASQAALADADVTLVERNSQISGK